MPPPLPRAVASEAFGRVKTPSPKSGVEWGVGIIPYYPPQGVRSPPGRADLGRGKAGGGGKRRGSAPSPPPPRIPGPAGAGGGGPRTHTHTPHAARANEPRPGAGGGVFPGSSTAAAIYLLGFSRGPRTSPRAPPPAAAPRLPAPGARAHTLTHARTHTSSRPGRSRGGNKTSWHVLRLQARPRRPADVKLQLGWCSS